MAAAKDKKFIPFPLYILEDGTERAIIPNDYQLELARENLRRCNSKLSELKDSEEVPEYRMRLAEHAAALAAESLETMESLSALRQDCRCEAYEICRPSFGEYTEIEERSKEWVDGAFTVIRAKLYLNLIPGNVRKNGAIFTLADARDLEPDEGPILAEAIERLCFPDPARAPFWLSRCKT